MKHRLIFIRLKVNFSKEDEFKRVKCTLGKLNWFMEKGYEVNLPVKIKGVANQGNIPADNEISEAVSSEFNQEEYRREAQNLVHRFEETKDDFFDKLTSLGLPIQSEYKVLITKYGVGGSYDLPNSIQINFDYSNAKDTLAITFHEIIHLTIEDLIRDNNIKHWTKKQIVNLIYSRFFPEKQKIQISSENSEQVDRIFNQFFPNIEKIVFETSKLDKVK